MFYPFLKVRALIHTIQSQLKEDHISIKLNLIGELRDRSSGNAFVSGGHSVANGSLPQYHLFEWSCVARAQNAEMGPANSLHA